MLFEIFDINKDGMLSFNEFAQVSAQKIEDGETSQAEIDWFKDQMNLEDDFSDHEISIDDLAERIKIQIDDGIEFQQPEVSGDGPSDEDREEAERISGEATDQMWFKVDTDNDGVIDENESEVFMETLDAD